MSGKLERLLVPGLLLAAGYYAVFGGEYSVFEVRRARTNLEIESAMLVEVLGDIDSLSAWADSLRRDPATIERIAREDFGMIRDGETLYRFVETGPASSGGDAQARDR
ncbi:MAG: septum formation initiator family protein [Gemmatimonadota bacterium]|nr:septum formation initiator family protein [Gemmatimonadota bacterium]